MKIISRLIALILLAAALAGPLTAAPDTGSSSAVTMEYKLIANFKQPFNDDLQLHLSKGWTPVGGVAVTVWNNDLYFAQLVGRAAKAGN
jgi:hypothetical protein